MLRLMSRGLTSQVIHMFSLRGGYGLNDVPTDTMWTVRATRLAMGLRFPSARGLFPMNSQSTR
jgi:hypothetical protein